jgi:hypothetical protein
MKTTSQLPLALLAAAVAAVAAVANAQTPIAPAELGAPKFEVSGSSITFTVQPSVSGRRYQLQWSDSMGTGTWQNRGAERIGDGGALVISAPHDPTLPRQFYKLVLDAKQQPFIRFIAPNSNVSRGLAVTLLGQNFAPLPAGNTVHFELVDQTWTAVVTEAAPDHLVVTAPMDLLVPPAGGSAIVYRVTVTTSKGTSNGVGCTVSSTTFKTFQMRPTQSNILQTPGTGKEWLAVGGGVPPYHLKPLTAFELSRVVATLNGPVLEVSAVPGVSFASITVRVEDSSVPPVVASSAVTVQLPNFAPEFSATFHTLRAGTAPGLTVTARLSSLQLEHFELRLQNAQFDLAGLEPGSVIGLLKQFYTNTIYGFQHLTVTEVSAERAKFDVISLADGGMTAVAHGELTANPPAIVIHIPNQIAESLMPTTVDEEFVFSDNIVRLPAAAGEKFSITAAFTSVSARADTYLPRHHTVTREFTTTASAAGAPRIDRLLPVHGEVGRIVAVRGTGFDATPANNVVTFAGRKGSRVRAEVLSQTPGEISVSVPRNALSGPVRVETAGQSSNDFQFYVRFHAEAVLFFESFAADTPVGFELIHQQPRDEEATAGEVPIESVNVTLDAGRLALAGLTIGQQVGTVIQTNLYTNREFTYQLIYAGPEAAPSQRFIFAVPISAGSSTVHSRIFALDDPDGAGVSLQIESGFVKFNAGIVWDYKFTSPVYRPPATAGTDVAERLEVVSQPWMSIPFSEMRVIKHTTHKVR